MKKAIYLFATIFLLSLTSHATVWTVSNNPADSAAANFSVLQTAIDAAGDNDTIYIAGSTASYGDIIILKPLTLIGTGYNPDNQYNLTSIVSTISFGYAYDDFDNVISAASGSKLIGLHVDNYIYTTISFSKPMGNILVQRCYISGTFEFGNHANNGIIIENCITGGELASLNNSTNVMIRNNIILGRIRNSNTASIVITNNVFHGSGSSDAFSEIYYATISNNIFYYTTPHVCYNTTFNNNISFSGGNNEFLYDSNTGTNNQVGVDPQFNNIVLTTGFSFDNDYTLADGSPAMDAGTDGTDIGITGGERPMTVEDTKFSPIPQIIQMDILNTTIPVDGTLNVRVNANVQN